MVNKENKQVKKDEFPEFKDDGIKTTKVTNLKDKIRLVMDQMKDLATMEVMLPVAVRMRKRLESVKKMSSADSLKISGHWRTIAPEIHIIGLEGKKLNNNECEIRFSVFDTDEKGNKKAYEHYSDVILPDGSTVKRCMSAEYRVAYEVIERILFRKPIIREIVRINTEDKNE